MLTMMATMISTWLAAWEFKTRFPRSVKLENADWFCG